MGFFEPTVWQAQREPEPLLPSCEKCGLFRHCKSPFMAVDGGGRRRVLIVAEAPGENEDNEGKALVGSAGSELARLIRNVGRDMRADCWLTNAAICRPTDERGHNRKPTPKELAWCRPNLAKAIKRLKPRVIVPLGEPATRSVIALAWKDGEVHTMRQWAGWDIPSVRLNAWVCPSYHPSYLLHEKSSAVELLMSRHLHKAFAHKNRPWDEKPDWDSRVVVEHDSRKAAGALESLFSRGVPLAFDYETTTLKPDGPHARILCCSVSDGEVSVAFPWVGRTRRAVQEFLRSDVPKIAANMTFEENWTWKEFGHGVTNWHWDTMAGAHWDDCRGGVCSLKFQAFVRFGVGDYDYQIDKYKQADPRGGNNPNRLHEVEPAVLLKYCGLDSLFEVMVAQDQWKGVRD